MPSSTDVTWRARTTANLLLARERSGRLRLGTKKSRTGCLTCKTRRIKCDEAQPECRRCQTSSKTCVWPFTTPSPPNHRSVSPVDGIVSDSLSLRQSERHAFEYFVSWAAPRLGGILDQEFWCGYVLQLSRIEPVVLDSLLAIATLYKHPQYMSTFKKRRKDPVSPSSKVALKAAVNGALDATPAEKPPPLDDHHAEALRLFNRAIRGFQHRAEQGQASSLLALVSCVLFICIETIRDNIHSTLTLVANGMALMGHLEKSVVNSGEQRLLLLLRRIFERFSIVALTFGHGNPRAQPPRLDQRKEQFEFDDLADARSKLFSMIAQSNAFIKMASRWKDSLVIPASEAPNEPNVSSTNDVRRFLIPASVNGIMTDGSERPYRGFRQMDEEARSVPMHTASEAPVQRGSSLQKGEGEGVEDISFLREMERDAKDRLFNWKTAFEALQLTAHEHALPKSHLMMYYHTYSIWMSTRLDPHQTTFDKFTQQFNEILVHAEVYTEAKAREQPIFTFEIGAVPPLYFVATKCRIPSLRRRALDLMRRTPPKESIWGAKSTAELCSRLVEFEEKGLGLPHPDVRDEPAFDHLDDSLTPLEERRIHTLELLQHPITMAFDIRVTRYLPWGGRLQKIVEEIPL